MFDGATLIAYVAVVIGAFLVPGPAVLLVLSRTVQGGPKIGLVTGAGIACGDFVHTIFAAVGLSAVLMSSAMAFNVVKYLGAAYLLYLGYKAFREKPSDPALSSVSAGFTLRPGQALVQAVLTEVLNPKTALFFLAFLPQFVRPERGSTLMQFAGLGLIFVVMSMMYTALLVLSFKPLGRLVGRWPGLVRQRNKIVGSIFMALGVSVVFQRR